MARFKHTDISQGQFITVVLKDQLIPGTFEWTIDYLIGKMNLSLYEKNYDNDEKGASAYPPKALLKATLYCYSLGILSSRKIERACKDNIIAKALAEGCEPDHATIAAFISANHKAVQNLFAQVVLQCAQLKLITGEMFAIDGCKLPSDASKEWSGTIADLTKKRDKLQAYIGRLVAQHKELDKDAGAKQRQQPFKETMGDAADRRARSVERLEKKLGKLNEFLATAEPRPGLSGDEVQSNITDNESALIKGPHGYIQGYNGIAVADSGSQVIVCAQAIGSGAESGCFPDMLDALDATMQTVTGKPEPLKQSLLLGDTGYFSENNLQEAAGRGVGVLIPDPQFRQRDPHFAEKKGEKAPKNARFTQGDFAYDEGKDEYTCPAGKVLINKGEVTLRNNSGAKYQAARKDCAQCPLRGQCIAQRKEKPKSKSPARTLYIAEKKHAENLSAKMAVEIDAPVNKELYSRRMQIIEPVFSHMTYCKGMDRFTLRGKTKVNIQWRLYCIVHNMWKCMHALGKKREIMG